MSKNKKNLDYIEIGKKKFFLNDYGFNVRTLLDAKDYYLKTKENIYFVKKDFLSGMKQELNLKKLNEMIEIANLSHRGMFDYRDIFD